MVADKIFANGDGSWKGGAVDSVAKKGKANLVAKASTVYNYQTLLNALKRPLSFSKDPGAIAQIKTDSFNKTIVNTKNIVQNVVPDVVGMSLKDAVYVLEQQGLRVRILGAGAIQAQSIAPGTLAKKGQIIIIQLS
jgi:hypothetical protein